MHEPTPGREENEEKLRLKVMITKKALEGTFDYNPLLSTTHEVICLDCTRRQSIVYLDYLKAGEFDFGEPEQIEVPIFQGAVSLLDLEKVTPLIITVTCDQCNSKSEIGPISVEYLQNIIDRPGPSRNMYA
jgi:hypothetical protein